MTTGFNTIVGTSSGDYTTLTSDISGGIGLGTTIITNITQGGSTLILFQSGTNGYLLSTDNGATWTRYANVNYTSGSDLRLQTLKHDGTIFYGFTNSTNYVTSSDGITWTKVNTTTNMYYTPSSIAKNGTTVVWVGSSGGCWRSTDDGVTWTFNSAFQTAVSYGSVQDVCYGNGYFVAVVGSKCMYSSDGITWTDNSSVYSLLSGNALMTVAFGNGYFVVGAVNGRVAYTTTPNSTWTESISLRTDNAFWGTSNVNKLAYVNSKFIAMSDMAKIGYCGNVPSADWTWGGTLSAQFGIVYDVVYAGTNYIFTQAKDYIFTSSDLATFTVNYTTAVIGFGSATRTAITYNGTTYVIGGAGGKIATSTDGVTWTYRSGLSSSGWGYTSTVNKIKWLNNKFVAIGIGGEFATSTDGVTWTYSGGIISSGFGAQQLNDVDWNGSYYVVTQRFVERSAMFVSMQ